MFIYFYMKKIIDEINCPFNKFRKMIKASLNQNVLLIDYDFSPCKIKLSSMLKVITKAEVEAGRPGILAAHHLTDIQLPKMGSRVRATALTSP